MPAYTNSTAIPRNEIAGAIVQGQGINQTNIWSNVLPTYGVNRRTSHLIKKTIADTDIARILTDKYITLPGAEIERMTLTYGDDTFTVTIRKREVKIPDEAEMDLQGYLSIEQDAANEGNKNLELTTEYLTAAAIFNTTNFGSATNSAVAYTNANLATISFINDVYASIERVRQKGEMPDTIIIPDLVYQRLRQSTLVKSFLESTSGFSPVGGITVTTGALQRAFADEGITQVLVGRSRYNTAVQGATPSFTKMWPVTYVWVGASGKPGMLASEGGIQTVQGVGANIFWEDYTPAGGYGVDTYREERVESNIVRTKTSIAPYIANGNAGDLIATQYS